MDEESAHRGGDGPPLVLLHGFTATWHTWLPVLPVLERHHAVFAPTLPGHAWGPPAPGHVSVATLADGVEALLDTEGIDAAHLVGSSLGGWIAMHLAARGRARSVVALSPAGGWAGPERRVPRIFRLMRAQALAGRPLLPILARFAAVRRLALRTVHERGDRLSASEVTRVVEGHLGCSVFEPLLDRHREEPEPLPRVPPDVPVLIAWSEHDRVLPAPRYQQRWLEATPEAVRIMLTGVGHVPMADDPALVAGTILDWTTGGPLPVPDRSVTDP
jgi:pimeloyl-ACP methyl ester carboxylesterase